MDAAHPSGVEFGDWGIVEITGEALSSLSPALPKEELPLCASSTEELTKFKAKCELVASLDGVGEIFVKDSSCLKGNALGFFVFQASIEML